MVSGGTGDGARGEQGADAAEDDRAAPEPVGEPADGRRRGVHAGDVQAQHHTDDTEHVGVAVDVPLDL